MSCPICIENFSSKNKQVKCLHCSFVACNVCVKKYLLESFQLPRCMNCKKDWNREFIANNLTKSWLNNEYKLHREEILFDKQISLLPSTQIYIESHNQIKKNDNVIYNLYEEKCVKITEIRKKIRELEQQRNDIITEYENKSEVYRANTELHKRFISEEIQDYPGEPLQENIEKINRNIFHGNCPVDDCKGFIGGGWVCGVCETKICSKCMEVKQSSHICNDDKVKNVELIKRDTKPCPGCKTLIFKQAGCYQMWCTLCHTTFHWRTGEVITKETIHNPHYIEFVQNNGINIRERCGEVNHGILQSIIANLPICKSTQRSIQTKFRELIYFLYDLRDRRMVVPNDDIQFKYLRIDYMRNRLSESEFKKEIQKLDKRVRKQQDVIQIYDMFYNVIQDYLQEYINDYEKRDEKRDDVLKINELQSKIIDLFAYSNTALKNINKIYNHSAQSIYLNIYPYF